MHMGLTTGPGTDNPWLILDDARPDGARSSDGLVWGSYVHGLFADDVFRGDFLKPFRNGVALSVTYDLQIETTLDRLAEHLEQNLSVDTLFDI